MHVRRHPRGICKQWKPGWFVVTDGFAVALWCFGFLCGCLFWWLAPH